MGRLLSEGHPESFAPTRPSVRAPDRAAAVAIMLCGLLVAAACVGCRHRRGAVQPPAAGELCGAALNGDSSRVRALLAAGADPNAPDPVRGLVPIAGAAASGAAGADIVYALAAGGADPNRADGTSAARTPLYWAVMAGADASKIDALLAVGADPDRPADADGRTALHIAALIDSRLATRQLVAHGADPRARDGRGRTPADVATAHGNDGLAALLRSAEAGTQPSAPAGESAAVGAESR